MREIIDGYRHFRSNVFPRERALYSKLANEQKPRYLFITCSDSRVQPHEFTGTGPGDMFQERSVGNLVPGPGSKEREAAAAVEYAVEVLGVAQIIICGHTQCGAMKALLDPASIAHLPMVSTWLESANPTRRAIARKYKHLQGEELLEAAVRENVVVQVDHMKKQPSVARRLAEGKVHVHGWVFDVEHGVVVVLDPNTGTFVPLLEAYPSEHA